jgi:thioredoxin-like negative regulator of GroEL
MRCAACGEENGERAVVCELCQAPLRPLATPHGRVVQHPTPAVPAGPTANAPIKPAALTTPTVSRSGHTGPAKLHIPEAPPSRGHGIRTALLALLGLGLAAAVGYGFWGGKSTDKGTATARQAAPPPVTPATPDQPARPSPRVPGAQPAANVAMPTPTPTTATRPANAPANYPIIEVKPSDPRTRSVSSSWFEGAEGLQRARKEQEYTNAPMIIYFRVDWCPYCQRMDQDITTSAVRQILADVVKVRINPESSPADAEAARGMGVKGYPSVYVIPRPGAMTEKVASLSRKENEALELSAEKFVKSVQAAGIRQAHNQLVEGYQKLNAGDTKGARADLDRAINLNPRNADAYFWRGEAEAKAGELGKAVGDFKRVLELAPDRKDAHLALANVYAGNRQYDEAIDYLTRAIRLDPNWQQGMAYALRASAHQAKGELDAAKLDYTEACRRGTLSACSSQR